MYRNEGDREAITVRYRRVRKKHEEDVREKHGLLHKRKNQEEC